MWMSRMFHLNVVAPRLPSSGSVAEPLRLMVWPSRNFAGAVMETAGALLPGEIVTVSVSLAPLESVTFRVAVKVPLVLYVWLGFADELCALPSPKFQS